MSKAPAVSFSKKLYSYCLVLVGSRNGFEHDFTIFKLKHVKGSCCFLEQETLSLLLSTGWFQEQI